MKRATRREFLELGLFGALSLSAISSASAAATSAANLRATPSMRWSAHEPPRLMLDVRVTNQGGDAIDVGQYSRAGVRSSVTLAAASGAAVGAVPERGWFARSRVGPGRRVWVPLAAGAELSAGSWFVGTVEQTPQAGATLTVALSLETPDGPLALEPVVVVVPGRAVG